MLLLDSESESFNYSLFLYVYLASARLKGLLQKKHRPKKISTGPLVLVLLCEYEKKTKHVSNPEVIQDGQAGTSWYLLGKSLCLSMSVYVLQILYYAFSPCILCRPEFGQLRTVGADYQGQSSMSAATKSTGKCEGCNKKVSISTVSLFLQIKR